MKASELLAKKKTVTAGGFSVGDTVSHPTLGQGKIVAIHYPEKPAETNLEIAFNGSEKTKSLKLMFVQEKLNKIGIKSSLAKGCKSALFRRQSPETERFLLCGQNAVEVALLVACLAAQ